MALSSRRSARPRFTLLLLVLTAVTILTLDQRGGGWAPVGTVKDGARDAFSPVQGALARVFSPIGDFVGGIVHYGDLEAENARLRRENEALQGLAARADDADREVRALLDQQDIEFVGDIPRIGARVVANARSNFLLTIEIGKGTADGVAQGMPVVTGAGLLGRVVEVSRTRATVLLITDRTSSVGIRLSSSGDIGVAGGRGVDADLPVDLIDPATVVEPDEVAVTSGIETGAFPPGIPVGTVVKAERRQGELQQDVTIKPVVDMSRLTFVQVLQWSAR